MLDRSRLCGRTRLRTLDTRRVACHSCQQIQGGARWYAVLREGPKPQIRNDGLYTISKTQETREELQQGPSEDGVPQTRGLEPDQ